MLSKADLTGKLLKRNAVKQQNQRNVLHFST